MTRDNQGLSLRDILALRESQEEVYYDQCYRLIAKVRDLCGIDAFYHSCIQEPGRN